MGAYTDFDYNSPDATTNGNLVPSEARKRAENALHNIIIASGGDPVDWNLKKYKAGVPVIAGDIADEWRWRRTGTDEIVRMVKTRDVDGFTSEEVYYFSIDAGSNWTPIRKRVYTRLTTGVASEINWSAI